MFFFICDEESLSCLMFINILNYKAAGKFSAYNERGPKKLYFLLSRKLIKTSEQGQD